MMSSHIYPPKEGLNKKFWLKWSPYFKKRGNLELKEQFQQKYETRVSLVEAGENSQLNEQIKSMMDSIENFITRKHVPHTRAFICPVCGQEAEYKNIRIREGFTEKVAVLFYFVQITSPPFPNHKTNVQVIKLGIGTTNLNNRFVLSLASFLVGEEKALQSLPSLEVRKSTNHQVVIKLASFSKSSLELIWVRLFQFTSETWGKNYTIDQVTLIQQELS